MKKFLIIFIILDLIVTSIVGYCAYGWGYNEGWFNASQCSVPVLQASLDEGYKAGYLQGQRDTLEQQPCCDICAAYPTREQVIAFLASDNTSEIPYNAKSFICTDFTETLNHNAWDAGIPCYTVFITFDDFYMGHAISAFPVCENGEVVLAYVDPQDDYLFDPDIVTVGHLYPISICDPNGSYCKLYEIGKIRIYY